jgi:large subunit ribosomal protein L25
MRTVEIIGYNRANLGKTDAKQLRLQALVPCVLYGGKEQKHFAVPMILFKDLLYTSEPAFVTINIEGDEYRAIVQDAQYNAVNEMILHVDFLLLSDKAIRMDIPVKLVGNSVGAQKGGKVTIRLRKLAIFAAPDKMPSAIEVDITHLDIGKTIKIKELTAGDYKIITPASNPIVAVETTRALKQAENDAKK